MHPAFRSTPAARAAALSAALAFGAAAAASGLNDLLAGAAADAQCTQTIVIGQCMCGPVPCGLLIERFVPVAVIETTKSPGDSIVAPSSMPASANAGTISSSISLSDNTAEAHVWSLSESLSVFGACPGCGAGHAMVPPLALEEAPAACGAVAPVTQAMNSVVSSVAGAAVPRLAYSSEADALNWRTGCRDIANASIGSGESIGAWGLLRPRQMRDIGPVGPLYSAKTAVRAMSIARDQLGSFPFPVDTMGRLQQVYPAISACFGVGALPLPQGGAMSAPVRVSRDGRYAWLYWRRVVCCIPYSSAARCLAGH